MMDPENAPDLLLEGWLRTLGIESLCQWDVLVFLYRHQASLVSAEHIGRLVGYVPGAVLAAVERLECLGYVQRSRVSQGVRLHQLTLPADSQLRDAFNRLMALTDGRAGRLLLSKKLPPDNRPVQDEAPPLGLAQKGVNHG